MRTVYLFAMMLVFGVFSTPVPGQTDEAEKGKTKMEKTKWTIVVTDPLVSKPAHRSEESVSGKEKESSSRKSEEVESSPEKKEAAKSVMAEEEEKAESGEKKEKKDQEAGKSAGASGSFSDWEKTWSVVAAFSTSFDSNLEHDPIPVRGFGFIPSITAGYQMRSGNQRLRFIYSFAAARYTIDTDLNRFGNYFAAAYRFSAGKWSFETDGEVSLKGTNEDRETNNQYVLTETIGYRFDKKTRINLYGAYRIRRFPSEDADRNAVNPMLGLKFSRELTKRFEWFAGYRYDENRAVNPRQNYYRSTYKTGFEAALTGNDQLETEISFRPRRYKNRLVDVGDAEVLRRDKKLGVDAVWRHNVTRHWGFETGYQFERQTSNDPDKIYTNHQIVFTVFYHWGNGDLIIP